MYFISYARVRDQSYNPVYCVTVMGEGGGRVRNYNNSSQQAPLRKAIPKQFRSSKIRNEHASAL